MADPEPTVPALGGWERTNLMWPAVSLAMLGMLAAAAWVVVSDADQPLPPFLQPGGAAAPPRASATASAAVPHADGLRLAGSGSNLPLTRALSAAFPRGQGRYSVVHASIGSGGGIRALLDGVIDIALISRPLRDGEREQGLVATPYARVPVVVAVHASVPDRAITRDQLVAIFDGSQRTWSSGAPVVVLQRERDDSSHWAIDRILPVFAAANEAAYRESRWRVLYRDDAMREALADTPGAIGLFGQGAIPPELPIEALTIDGVRPSVDAVRDGTYPFTKDFAFVTRGAPTGQARAFIDFVLSEPGRGIIEAAGALPLDGHLRTPAEEP